jgi:septum formation protein
VVPEVEELTEGDPGTAVLENARRKARAVVERVGVREVVMAADTEVVLDGRVLGKATTRDEARERLRLLSGRTHEVLTGLVLIGPSGTSKGDFVRRDLTKPTLDEGAVTSAPGGFSERSGIARSQVTFRELEASLVEMYVASGEWRDRAGAYAVQGFGSALVVRADGDLSNVIGLPVNLLLELAPELLDEAGRSLSAAELQPDSKV